MALPLIAAALPSVIGGISNLIGSGKRKREEEKASASQSQLVEMFKSQLGQSYFDSAEGMGASTQIQQNQQDMNNQINTTANINGLTDEARIAMMGKNNMATAGAYADLSKAGDFWRQRNMQQYQGALGGLFNMGQQNRANRNQSIQNILGPLQQGIDTANSLGAFENLGKRNQVAAETGWKPNRKMSSETSGTPGAAGAIADLFKNYKPA
ncbi:hypothetical protein J2X69_002680 [Algoriphagus sp. 4150]|uniref:hypothetical protein n=1 Tax=Algoriphagus sp. 4150 TaxID=2817756 RepID=UPI002856EA12|nr:hypothetical protein [Algoriphagus sp. 4150]MDR7130330.1 hypothetical protein [Algoriphagus sp. 4150]